MDRVRVPRATLSGSTRLLPRDPVGVRSIGGDWRRVTRKEGPERKVWVWGDVVLMVGRRGVQVSRVDRDGGRKDPTEARI